MRNIGLSVSGSLVAAGIAWIITGPGLRPGFIIIRAGLLGLVATYLLTKRSPPSKNPQVVHQENTQTQTFSPKVEQHVHIIGHGDEAERERKERDRHDRMMLEYVRQQHKHRPAMKFLVNDASSSLSLSFYDADQSLKRLFDEGKLYRDEIDAPGDYVYGYRGPE
jgi:hypothetical protein